jgi:hypothetical protein
VEGWSWMSEGVSQCERRGVVRGEGGKMGQGLLEGCIDRRLPGLPSTRSLTEVDMLVVLSAYLPMRSLIEEQVSVKVWCLLSVSCIYAVLANSMYICNL